MSIVSDTSAHGAVRRYNATMNTTPSEAAPVLCKRCGAPTDLQNDLWIRCRFCGTADRLPWDAAQRALDVRERLSLAASHARQLASGEAAMAAVFEDPARIKKMVCRFGAMGLFVLVMSAFNACQTLNTSPDLPRAIAFDMLIGVVYPPLALSGVVLGAVVSFLVGRSTYRHHLRHVIAPRPALYRGAPLRCRVCGANLPMHRAERVACSFCATENLLTAAVTVDARRQLDAEIAGYRARASGVVDASARAGSHVYATTIGCFLGASFGMQIVLYGLKQLAVALA